MRLHCRAVQVMFAEPLGSRTRSSGDFSADSQAGSGGAGNGAAGGATYMGTPQDGSLHLLHSPQVRACCWCAWCLIGRPLDTWPLHCLCLPMPCLSASRR